MVLYESPYKPETTLLCVRSRSRITIALKIAPKSLETLLICNGGYLILLGFNKIGDSNRNQGQEN
jgi:hypothetical protein